MTAYPIGYLIPNNQPPLYSLPGQMRQGLCRILALPNPFSLEINYV